MRTNTFPKCSHAFTYPETVIHAPLHTIRNSICTIQRHPVLLLVIAHSAAALRVSPLLKHGQQTAACNCTFVDPLRCISTCSMVGDGTSQRLLCLVLCVCVYVCVYVWVRGLLCLVLGVCMYVCVCVGRRAAVLGTLCACVCVCMCG